MKSQINILFLHQINSICGGVLILVVRYCTLHTLQLNSFCRRLKGFFVGFFSSHLTHLTRRGVNKMRVTVWKHRNMTLRGLFQRLHFRKVDRWINSFLPFLPINILTSWNVSNPLFANRIRID